MAVEAVSFCEHGTGRLPAVAVVSPTGLCALEVLTPVIAALTRRSIGPDEVRDRAVALGLLGLPAPGTPSVLTCKAAARLLLAGYRLPAQVEPGTRELLRPWLRRGLQVFVSLWGLDTPGGGRPAVYQLHGLHGKPSADLRLSLGESEAPVDLIRQVPLARFLEAWTAADNLLFVAARQWGDLPHEGHRFFGGSRDLDGTYHWDAAECVTDDQGRILRC